MGCSCRMKKKIHSTWTRNVSNKTHAGSRLSKTSLGPSIPATRKALGLEPRLDIAEHVER